MHDLHINYCKTSGKQSSQIYQSLMDNRESVSTNSRSTLETPRSQGRLLPCSNMAQFTSTEKTFPTKSSWWCDVSRWQHLKQKLTTANSMSHFHDSWFRGSIIHVPKIDVKYLSKKHGLTRLTVDVEIFQPSIPKTNRIITKNFSKHQSLSERLRWKKSNHCRASSMMSDTTSKTKQIAVHFPASR